MVLCLSLAVLTGCKKNQNDDSTGAKQQQAVTSRVSSSPRTSSAASTDAASPSKRSEKHVTASSGAPPKEPILAEVLASVGLKPQAETVQDLDRPISSYAALNDREAYLIAYYWSLPSGLLEDPLRVLSFDRQTEDWKNAQLMLGGEQVGHSECVGSVLRVHALPSAFLIDTHINPSAGCLLILERNLAFRRALSGWYLAALDGAQIVFQRSEVHFAPVHPAELALYDLKTNRETSLFPRKPFQRIRAEYTAKLREFYRTHQEWCQENDDPCDPEEVDSTLQGEVAVNQREFALAFVMDYDSYDRFQDSAGPAQKPVSPGKVVYIYRGVNDEAKLDYRELLLSDIEKRFGKLPLSSLLEPEALREIFGSSSVTENSGGANSRN